MDDAAAQAGDADADQRKQRDCLPKPHLCLRNLLFLSFLCRDGNTAAAENIPPRSAATRLARRQFALRSRPARG
jgi:hypothetical protein